MKINKIHHVAVICSDYELSKLNKTCVQSEKHGTAYQNRNDDIRPKEIANLN